MMDELVKWGGWLVAAVMATITIRGTISFDVNKWLNDRRENEKEKIRALCPHVKIRRENGELVVRDTFVSPPGAVEWQCQQCGFKTYDGAEPSKIAEYWAKNPEKLGERMNQINKIRKKLLR